MAPRGTSMVFTQEEMIVVFKVTGARRAAMVLAKSPFVKKGTNRELFPSELMEEGASSSIFGIN